MWYERDGALIDVEDEKNWLAVDRPVACLREEHKEEDAARRK